MSLDPEILAVLVCPESHGPVKQAEQSLLDEVNTRIAAGDVKTHAGEAVSSPVKEALVREDGKCLYRVDDGIPNLLVDERIDL